MFSFPVVPQNQYNNPNRYEIHSQSFHRIYLILLTDMKSILWATCTLIWARGNVSHHFGTIQKVLVRPKGSNAFS